LHVLCDRAKIGRRDRARKLFQFLSMKSMAVDVDVDSPLPSEDALKDLLQTGAPLHPKDASRRILKYLDEALGAAGSLYEQCEEFWNRTSVPTAPRSETWYQVIAPTPPDGQASGRPFFSIDRVELTVNGEDLFATMTRIAPESNEEFGLRWEATGYARGAHRFLAFNSWDAHNPRSYGVIGLRRVGYVRQEDYEGFYTRSDDVAGYGECQPPHRPIRWHRSPPRKAWPRVALLDWDNSLCSGWTVRPFLAYLARHDAVGQREALVDLDDAFAKYPGQLSHSELAAVATNIYARAVDGQLVGDINALATTFVSTDEEQRRIYPWTSALMQQLVRQGIAPVLVSGAPSPVLRAWSRRLGVEEVVALDLPSVKKDTGERYEGALEARVNPGTREGKQGIVEQVIKSGREVVLALGDSESDRPLWESTNAGICIGPHDATMTSEGPILRLIDPRDPDSTEVLMAWVETKIPPWHAS
jgi:phosphoserine phosphatase